MKPNRKNPILLASLTFALTLAAPSAFAANLYWDINGTATGFSTVVGAWNTGNFWNTDSTGGSGGTVTATTTGVDDLIIGPATTNTGTITLTGTKILKSLTFGTTVGAVTLTGGTLSLAGGGGITVASTAGNQIIRSNLTISGNNIINVGSGRTLTLNTGTFTRSAGATLSILGGGTGSSTMTGLSANDATGIIGTWASAGSGTGTTYAKFSVSSFSGLSYTGGADGTLAAASTNVSSTLGTVNYALSAAGTLGTNANINTLRWGGGAGTLATDTSFTTKGIMNAGTGKLTFSGAVTSGASGTEMVVNTANADIDFNGAFTGTITKTGSGTMTLGNVAHSIGGITVNQGILISDGSGITGNSTVNSGGTLLATKAAALPGYNLASRVSVLNGATLAVRAGGAGEWISSEIDSLLGATTAAFANGSNLGVEVTTSNSFTYANNIGATQAAKGLTKSGAGTLILSGANTYTGTTSIGAGTLKLSGAGTPGLAGSEVAVSGGALLDLNGTNQNIKFIAGTGVGTVANNSGSGTSMLTLAASPAANVLIQDYTTTPGGKVAVIVTVNTSNLSIGNTYSGGTTVNAGAFLYNNPGGSGTGMITLTATNSGLLVNGGTYANDVSGAGYIHNNVNGSSNARFTGTLNTSGTFNFRNASAAFEFAGSGNSILSGVIGPAGAAGIYGPNVTVSTGRIIKSGAGTLTLSNPANLYSGSTTIAEGILNANSTGALGSGGANNTLIFTGGTLQAGGSIVSPATRTVTLTSTGLIDTNNNAVSIAGIMSGAGGLTKSGLGILTLSATNTYTGATLVSAGTLEIASTGSTHSSSGVTVSNAGTALVVNGTINGTLVANVSTTVSGNGTVVGAASVSGALNPGNSPGVLSFGGDLTMAATTATTMEINGTVRGTDHDGINVGNTLTYDGSLTLALGSTFTLGSYTFNLFDLFAGTSGSFDSVSLTGDYAALLTNDGFGVWTASTNSGNESWTFTQGTGDLALTVIPEPNAAALLGLTGTLLLLRRRKRA